MADGRTGDFILPPGTYAYVLDSTNGQVNTYVGPVKASLSDTDQPVLWREGEFSETTHRDHATQNFIKAAEGQYVILNNPVEKDSNDFPPTKKTADTPTLAQGRKVVIPGPISFPLWPGQSAQTLEGHHLRNNQYLVVRVYEPDAARANAEQAVVETTTGNGGGDPDSDKPKPKGKQTPKAQVEPLNYTMGKQFIIKGTDVSFYIPPTGIEVIPDSHQEYVRGAVTLQRLEYCILLDESGDKRYVEGPAVVFPKPTEIFQTDDDGKRRFQAIELNQQSGLYIKVITDYEDETGTYKTGEERFITGANQPIYFPRPEESIISYGDQRKHHAVAVPSGEGRYVLNREEGSVDLVRGPKMFLPDPRKQVIIRRILDQKLCSIMYPGNEEALAANAVLADQGTQFASMIEDEALKGIVSPPTAASYLTSVSALPQNVLDSLEYARGLSYTSASPSAMPGETPEQAQKRAARATGAARAAKSVATEGITRGTTYTPPRTIVLDTKYQGAVRQTIYPGYAIMLVNSQGDRRVITGPETVLLEYDESPMMLSLSSGKPKTTDRLVQDCYLRTVNNQVSDHVYVETKDLVPLQINLSYRVNFEGDPNKWFNLDNYVKVLSDHCRSKLRNLVKRHQYRTFYDDAVDLIRDCLLGEQTESGERPGLSFDENDMRLFEIEVLKVAVNNQDIDRLTREATYNILEGSIRLSEAESRADQETRLEELKRQSLDDKDTTSRRTAESALLAIDLEHRGHLERLTSELEAQGREVEIAAQRREELTADADLRLRIDRERWDVEHERLKGEASVFQDRVKAIGPNLIAAIGTFGDQRFTEELMRALGPVALATGTTAADMFANAFEGTPVGDLMNTLAERPFRHAVGVANGGGER